MSRRRRSSFRRQGKPFGVDGRNKVAIARDRRSKAPPYHGEAKRERDADNEAIVAQIEAVGASFEKAMRDFRQQYMASVALTLEAMSRTVERIRADLATFVPRDVDATVVGFDLGAGDDTTALQIHVNGKALPAIPLLSGLMTADAGAGQFTCAVCGQTFDKARSDEEADAELAERFGTTREATDCAVVCDDCFRQIMGEA